MVTPSEILQSRILIVDDMESNISTLRIVLRAQGYTNIRSTTDPFAAAGMYAEFRPDIVLLDLDMPPTDGFAVMQQIREIEQSTIIPVVIVTANNDTPTRHRALKEGARDFLTKPFNAVEISVRIGNLLETRLQHKQILRHNEELELRVAEATEELRKTQLEIIHRLGHAAEYKDNETGFHIIRMSLYCGVLARSLGMSAEECEMIESASPMHDVGKIGIPDRVLLKPGKLDAAEWAIMQKHAEIGADMLAGSNSPMIQMAELIAMTHHEKWNGNGYPRGLIGEEIPLVGRIVAVCDVFDALTSERPYKHAWTVEASIAEIVRGAGQHFDPQLVELFALNLPEILQIREKYQED